MANIIEFVNVGGTAYNIASTAYAVCGQDATTPAKTINIDGFSLASGVTIHVKFTNAHTTGSPTLAITGGDTAAATAHAITGISSWEAGAIITLTYDGTNWVRDYVDPNTSGITGTGTSGRLAKFNGAHTITDGPALASSISTQTQSTKFLREDGTWQAPTYTTNTDEKVAQTANTENKEFSILLKNSNDYNNETQGVKFANTANKKVTINPSTGVITAPGGLAGNASTATEFSSGTTVKLTGNVTGESSSSKKGWTIATTIANNAVTNNMLAGSIENEKLSNYKVTIAGNQISLGGSLDAVTLRTSLGLTQALRFVGSTTSTMTESFTGVPAGISIYTGTDATTPAVGDVVLDSSNNAEYVCTAVSGTTYTWEQLGAESSWALDNTVIHNSLLHHKGAIIYASSVDTPAELQIGTEGQVLKVSNSGVPVWSTDLNNKMTQVLDSSTDTFPLLFSDNKTSVTTASITTSAKRNNSIYVKPSAGELHATKFVGDGSGLTNVTASSVAWGNVTSKILTLYVNGTSSGADNNTAATTNNDTYIHLYSGSSNYSTVKLIGAGGTSVSSAANSNNITITSNTYVSSGSANAITSLKVKYDDGTAHDDSIGSATGNATALGTVTNAILYIKSMYYGTTSVSTGVTTG